VHGRRRKRSVAFVSQMIEDMKHWQAQREGQSEAAKNVS
jgi:hypothetical protein